VNYPRSLETMKIVKSLPALKELSAGVTDFASQRELLDATV
jgi:hypothetical protein